MEKYSAHNAGHDAFWTSMATAGEPKIQFDNVCVTSGIKGEAGVTVKIGQSNGFGTQTKYLYATKDTSTHSKSLTGWRCRGPAASTEYRRSTADTMRQQVREGTTFNAAESQTCGLRAVIEWKKESGPTLCGKTTNTQERVHQEGSVHKLGTQLLRFMKERGTRNWRH